LELCFGAQTVRDNDLAGGAVDQEGVAITTLAAEGGKWWSVVCFIVEPSVISHKNAFRAYVLPKFGERKITEINREDIQTFLAEQARKYRRCRSHS
jgi:Phage integrase, N-terminal SAM-like domain